MMLFVLTYPPVASFDILHTSGQSLGVSPAGVQTPGTTDSILPCSPVEGSSPGRPGPTPVSGGPEFRSDLSTQNCKLQFVQRFKKNIAA